MAILCAGLDTRAHTLSRPPGGADVFEIDHPHGSTWKQKMVRLHLPDDGSAVHYRAINLRVGSLTGALLDAGLDPNAPRFVIWCRSVPSADAVAAFPQQLPCCIIYLDERDVADSGLRNDPDLLSVFLGEKGHLQPLPPWRSMRVSVRFGEPHLPLSCLLAQSCQRQNQTTS